MSETAKSAMNSLSLYEMNVLNVSCGYVAIISNGQLCAVVPEEKAAAAEKERTNRGC